MRTYEGWSLAIHFFVAVGTIASACVALRFGLSTQKRMEKAAEKRRKEERKFEVKSVGIGREASGKKLTFKICVRIENYFDILKISAGVLVVFYEDGGGKRSTSIELGFDWDFVKDYDKKKKDGEMVSVSRPYQATFYPHFNDFIRFICDPSELENFLLKKKLNESSFSLLLRTDLIAERYYHFSERQQDSFLH